MTYSRDACPLSWLHRARFSCGGTYNSLIQAYEVVDHSLPCPFYFRGWIGEEGRGSGARRHCPSTHQLPSSQRVRHYCSGGFVHSPNVSPSHVGRPLQTPSRRAWDLDKRLVLHSLCTAKLQQERTGVRACLEANRGKRLMFAAFDRFPGVSLSSSEL